MNDEDITRELRKLRKTLQAAIIVYVAFWGTAIILSILGYEIHLYP
jgi:hypothetical protein